MSWSWENINKQDVTQLAEGLIRSIKQYNAIPKTINKEFYNYITESFNRFLDKLNGEDFKKLNQYISDSLSKNPLPKDFNLLIRLLKKLNKLDKAVENKIKNSLLNLKYNSRYKLQDLQELIKSGANVDAKNNSTRIYSSYNCKFKWGRKYSKIINSCTCKY